MSDVEQILVLARAIDVRDGAMSIEEAAEHVRTAPLTPDDTANVRWVSSAVRGFLETDQTAALVFATLNEIVADRTGDADLRALTRFDLANAYIGEDRLDEALPILDDLHRELASRDVRGVPYEAVAGNRAAVRAHLGDAEDGIAALRELIADASTVRRRVRWRVNLAATYEGADRAGEALAEYDRAMSEVEAMRAAQEDDPTDRELDRLLLGASLGAGRTAHAVGDLAGAVERLRPAGDLAVALHDPHAAWEMATLLGRSLAGLGETERAAHAFGMALDVHVETGVGRRPDEVTRSMVGLFRSLGRSAEAAARLTSYAERGPSFGRPDMRVSFTIELAELHTADGDVDAAVATFRRAAEYGRAVGEPAVARGCLMRAGDLLAEAGRLDEARDDWAEALAWAEAADDLSAQVDILFAGGRADALAGRNTEAAAALRRAAALAVPLADVERATAIDDLLGGVLLALGDMTGSAERYELALAGYHSTGDHYGEAAVRSGLAAAYTSLGRGEDAMVQAEAALAIGRRLDHPGLVAEASAVLADAHEMHGRSAEALDGYARAAELAESGPPALLARYLEGKANALREQGRPDEARPAYAEALRAADRAGDRDREASVRSNLSVLDLAAGRVEEALAHNVFATEQARRLGNDWLLVVALGRLAEAHWAAGRAELAGIALAEAREIAERQGYGELVWRAAAMLVRMAGDEEAADVAREDSVDLIERLSGVPGSGRREDMLAQLAMTLREFDDADEDRRARIQPALRRLMSRFGAEAVLDDTSRDDASTDGPSWTRDARRYVATGEAAYLHRAAAEADEPARDVLTRLGERDGIVDMDEWAPAVRMLEAHGARLAAASLNLAAALPMLRAAGAPGLSADADRALAAQCEQALALAESLGFTECRAAFAAILGARATARAEVEEARWHLFTAARLFGRLARTEPDVYRRPFALALNGLAGLHRATGDVGPGLALHRRAVAELSTEHGDVAADDLLPLLAILHDLARSQTDEHDDAGAAETLGIAFRHMDAAAATGRDAPAMRISLLRAKARVHMQRRQPAAARALEDEVAALVRGFGRPRGSAAGADLAASLTALGAVVAAQDDPDEAGSLFAEAVRLARETGAADTLVAALQNLAGVHYENGRQQQADATYREAVALQRPLADERPEVHEPRLVDLLLNLGTSSLAGGDLSAAAVILAEAVERGRRVHRRRPGRGRRTLIAALDRLGRVRAALGADVEADALAGEAVRLAEHGRTRADTWLWKGWAADSYHRLLIRAFEARDAATAHACLAALREAAVGVSEPRPEESLDAAVAALARIESSGGPRVRVVIAERLDDDVDLMGVLDRDGLRLRLTNDAVVPARGLYDAVATIFEAPDAAGRVSEETLAMISAAVLAALPDPVREALADRSGSLLVSGDPYWTMFPWETLCSGSGADPDWLGLDLPLPRASGLTAAALGGLRAPAGDGAGPRTAAVVSPWDADADEPLEDARDEAVEVAGILTQRGYTLLPDGVPMLGAAADAAALRRALSGHPAVIHYSGHADLVGGEEVLLLAGPDGVYRFGTSDLAGPAGMRLLPQAPLVVLNGCRAGQARAFGGRREDLLSTFLAEGAAVVVASAFPVDEVVGRIVGTALYQGPPGEEVGAAVVRLRRLLAGSDDPLARALWRLLTCHGNHLVPVP